MNNTNTTTAINLGRTHDQARIARMKAALEGQTYMRFKVRACPACGEFELWAETDYEAEESEIRDFLMAYLASIVMRGH